ncbi:HAD family hydrolase [Salinispira pacifica]
MALPPFRACIFDMDGLLLDTERLAVTGWVEAAAALGFDLPYEFALATVGLDRSQSKQMLLHRMGQDFPYEEVRELRNAINARKIEADGVPLKPGGRELIGLLLSKRIPFAQATSTQRSRAEELLSRSGIRADFTVVLCGDEVEKGKPAPEIYLKTADRLGVPAEECLVFEDSGPGLLAAHRAGMTPVLVPDIGEVAEEIRVLATAICETLLDAIPLVDDATRRMRPT